MLSGGQHSESATNSAQSSLIHEIELHGIKVSTSQHSLINRLSKGRFLCLQMYIHRLIEQHLLSVESFTETLNRVAHKIAPVPESTFDKVKINHRAQITLNNKVTFFIDRHSWNKSDMSGANGCVNPAHADYDGDQLLYAVKSSYYNVEQCKKKAAKEAKYNAFFHHNVFWYTAKKCFNVGYDWQFGIPLNKLLSTISNYPYERRLLWLISVLKQINELHRNLHVFNDLGPGNTVLNMQTDTLSLIDFGSAEKIKYDLPKWCSHLLHDMKSIGMLVIDLFPEINSEPKDFTVFETAIIKLKNSLMENVGENRCTSLQALNYCEHLLTNYHQLTQAALEDILESTINRKQLTVDDILRDSCRATSL